MTPHRPMPPPASSLAPSVRAELPLPTPRGRLEIRKRAEALEKLLPTVNAGPSSSELPHDEQPCAHCHLGGDSAAGDGACFKTEQRHLLKEAADILRGAPETFLYRRANRQTRLIRNVWLADQPADAHLIRVVDRLIGDLVERLDRLTGALPARATNAGILTRRLMDDGIRTLRERLAQAVEQLADDYAENLLKATPARTTSFLTLDPERERRVAANTRLVLDLGRWIRAGRQTLAHVLEPMSRAALEAAAADSCLPLLVTATRIYVEMTALAKTEPLTLDAAQRALKPVLEQLWRAYATFAWTGECDDDFVRQNDEDDWSSLHAAWQADFGVRLALDDAQVELPWLSPDTSARLLAAGKTHILRAQFDGSKGKPLGLAAMSPPPLPDFDAIFAELDAKSSVADGHSVSAEIRDQVDTMIESGARFATDRLATGEWSREWRSSMRAVHAVFLGGADQLLLMVAVGGDALTRRLRKWLVKEGGVLSSTAQYFVHSPSLHGGVGAAAENPDTSGFQTTTPQQQHGLVAWQPPQTLMPVFSPSHVRLLARFQQLFVSLRAELAALDKVDLTGSARFGASSVAALSLVRSFVARLLGCLQMCVEQTWRQHETRIMAADSVEAAHTTVRDLLKDLLHSSLLTSRAIELRGLVKDIVLRSQRLRNTMEEEMMTMSGEDPNDSTILTTTTAHENQDAAKQLRAIVDHIGLFCSSCELLARHDSWFERLLDWMDATRCFMDRNTVLQQATPLREKPDEVENATFEYENKTPKQRGTP